MEKKKGFRKVPHTYVILFSLVLIISILTWILPASTYDMVELESGRKVVDPATFHYIDKTPVGPLKFLMAFPEGMQQAAEIVFFIFILGGAFEIINKTGTMEVGVSNLAKSLGSRGTLLIPGIIFVFSILGGTIGMAEETIIFIPIGVALARSLGFDALVGMAIVTLGSAVGFNSGFMNPFTVGVAQGIAGLPPFSGIGLRLVVWGVFFITAVVYVTRYAVKVRDNPELSIVKDLEEKEKHMVLDLDKIEKMTSVHWMVTVIFVAAIALIVYGVFKLDFYITEIAAIFLGMALISGIIGRLSPNEMATAFIEGAKGIAMGALVVGIARAILVVMNDGNILYTIVHGISNVITLVPKQIAAVLMFIFQLFLNFFIPSGSGQAATTMPIMAPLADILGITKQTAVLAFHLGDGISNQIIPTGGSLLAALSVANIDYEKWVKFVWPLILIFSILACIFTAVATAINYGPF